MYIVQCWTAKLNKKKLMMYFCLKHPENMFLIFAKKKYLATPKFRAIPLRGMQINTFYHTEFNGII